MDNLALHPQTAAQLRRFIQYPTHALLLIGPEGSGKYHLALEAASSLLDLADYTQVTSYPYAKFVVPEKDKSSIGIEAIRELQHFALLKVPSKADGQPNRRFIIIPEANSLTIEAQNALLKLLEEPPRDTHFILTASGAQAMLPTVRSRVQTVAVHRPSRVSLEQHFAAAQHGSHDVKAIQQAYFMSGGLPGLMHALLNNNDNHPLKEASQIARQLLQAGQFERLCRVDELSKKRSETLQVLLVLRHMSIAAIEQGAQTGGEAGTKRIVQWHKVLQASYDAEKAYGVSAQAKLVLTKLMLTI